MLEISLGFVLSTKTSKPHQNHINPTLLDNIGDAIYYLRNNMFQ